MALPGKPRATAPVRRLRHEVRIIGGVWKRTRLAVADLPGLRPTPARVRETLFNWLGQDLSGWRCVDAFAGTGALGFEAASRGAREVVLVERDPALVDQLNQTRARLGADRVRVVRGDAVAWLRQQVASSIDLVLLDPPFDSPLAGPALAAAARVVTVHGMVYLEAPQPWPEGELQSLGLVLHRQLKAGAVVAHLLKLREAAHA